MSNKYDIDNERWFLDKKKEVKQIVEHKMFKFLSLSSIQSSVLRIIINADSYKDIPNVPIDYTLDIIKENLNKLLDKKF